MFSFIIDTSLCDKKPPLRHIKAFFALCFASPRINMFITFMQRQSPLYFTFSENAIANSGSALQGSDTSYSPVPATVDGQLDTCSPELIGISSSWFVLFDEERRVDQVLVFVNGKPDISSFNLFSRVAIALEWKY